MVPTFTTRSIGQGGAQLYSGSIATPTPQAFNVASPPEQASGFGVDPPARRRPRHVLHIGPRGGAPGGVMVRVLQRILAMTAAIWHNHHTGQPVMRSLTAYDH